MPQDPRHAVRLVRKSPGFAFTAALTLALSVALHLAPSMCQAAANVFHSVTCRNAASPSALTLLLLMAGAVIALMSARRAERQPCKLRMRNGNRGK